MEFLIDQDRVNNLRFYLTPVDPAAAGGALLRSIMERMVAGDAGPASLSAAKVDLTHLTVDAFKGSNVYRWLKKCEPGTLTLSGGFEQERGSLPIPRISILFAAASLAAKFKMNFAGTETARDDIEG